MVKVKVEPLARAVWKDATGPCQTAVLASLSYCSR